MKLIFAQGNPGREYENSRHNVGFMTIDTFAAGQRAEFINKPKFNAEIAELSIAGDKVLLVKPTTFYNETGIAARKLTYFYKIIPSEDLLVIHDDLALPFGTIRVRKKGSDAGNNGIKSFNTHIGQEYARLRVGIGTENRTNDDASFVLSNFNSTEGNMLKEKIIPKLNELINDFLAGKLEYTSHALE
jgi:PTH1 family peptidyl-tRNA hydrolase